MKKIIMTLALAASMFAMASTDVYTFKTTMKYPKVGNTAFVPAVTPVSGTLVVEGDATAITSAVLTVTLKKTKETFTLVATNMPEFAVFGKKDSDCALALQFVNEDTSTGLIELTFYGWGILKTKTTGGCTPCGDTTETCSKVTKMTGVIGGKYICPCGGTFIGWNGSCTIDPTIDAPDMAVYGTAAVFVLKKVNGAKW